MRNQRVPRDCTSRMAISISVPWSAEASRPAFRVPIYPGTRCVPLTDRKLAMSTRRLGIIMHGVTGRMGMNQHLIRSIVAIRKQGGVLLANGDRVMPDPVLIGRNLEKITALRSEEHTSELQSLMRISYAVFCWKKKNRQHEV